MSKIGYLQYLQKILPEKMSKDNPNELRRKLKKALVTNDQRLINPLSDLLEIYKFIEEYIQ